MRVSSVIFTEDVYKSNLINDNTCDYVLTICLKGSALIKFTGSQPSTVIQKKNAILSSASTPYDFKNLTDDCTLVSACFSINNNDAENLKDWLFFLSYDFMIQVNDLIADLNGAADCEIISQRLTLRLKYLLSRLRNRENKLMKVAC